MARIYAATSNSAWTGNWRPRADARTAPGCEIPSDCIAAVGSRDHWSGSVRVRYPAGHVGKLRIIAPLGALLHARQPADRRGAMTAAPADEQAEYDAAGRAGLFARRGALADKEDARGGRHDQGQLERRPHRPGAAARHPGRRSRVACRTRSASRGQVSSSDVVTRAVVPPPGDPEVRSTGVRAKRACHFRTRRAKRRRQPARGRTPVTDRLLLRESRPGAAGSRNRHGDADLRGLPARSCFACGSRVCGRGDDASTGLRCLPRRDDAPLSHVASKAPAGSEVSRLGAWVTTRW
jgi:hypothetical protein